MSTTAGSVRSAAPKFPPKLLPVPFLVNSVAISDDAKHVVGGTFYFPYFGTTEKETHAAFGAYCYDYSVNPAAPAGAGAPRLWVDEYLGSQGVFAVAIAGSGRVAAAGGLFTDKPVYQGLLRAYDADTGKVLLDYTQIRPADPSLNNGRLQRVSCVALSDDGAVLAAVADQVYVFIGDGKSFPSQPTEKITFDTAFNKDNIPTAVAVHPSGKWLVACDKGGHVCLATIADGAVQKTFMWTADPVLFDRTKQNDPTAPKGPIIFLSIAIARGSDSFVAGGNDFVYLFTFDEMVENQRPVAAFDTWDQTPPPPSPAGAPAPTTTPQNVRWVAISGDGGLITTVINRFANGQKTGSLIAYRNSQPKPAWEKSLPRNPNSTSVDLAGRYVAACDGFPFGTPGAFYLFDAASGESLWTYPTSNMNWPIVISGNGKGIAAGGDDGLLYYFESPAVPT